MNSAGRKNLRSFQFRNLELDAPQIGTGVPRHGSHESYRRVGQIGFRPLSIAIYGNLSSPGYAPAISFVLGVMEHRALIQVLE